LRQFHQKLQRWYAAHGRRDLPWRNTRDVYAIYLSEVMLQQTQVETVRTRFYPQFLKNFPTLGALAKASEKDVLSAWQGLGYYSRARNLHKAAQACKGALPKTVEGLLALSGVGKNTAHAVAAFGYHHPVPVMEANVKRVLCRIFALEKPSEKELWEKAEALLDANNPFDYNQAMMDIGAGVCTKRAAKCVECPASEICEGKKTYEAYPQAKKKKTVPVRRKNILVMMDREGRVASTPRTTRFLHGLYHFTEQEAPPPAHAEKLGYISQSYSHFTLEAAVYVVRTNSAQPYSIKQLHALPMSMAEKKILQLLAGRATNRA